MLYFDAQAARGYRRTADKVVQHQEPSRGYPASSRLGLGTVWHLKKPVICSMLFGVLMNASYTHAEVI